MLKKIKFTTAIFVFIFINTSMAFADPCAGDPICYDPGYGKTNFSNPFHYVFVGAHPDDELTIYPLMKDFCSESNAYCAMLIGTKGRTGCDSGISASDCADERENELHNSAKYLVSDVWLYDLPGGTEIASPSPTMAQIRAVWNTKAAEAGFGNMVNFFKQKFTELKAPSSSLVVFSLHPSHGSTGHLAHRAMGEFVSAAIDSLNAEGISVSKFLIDTYLDQGEDYVEDSFFRSYGSASAVCRSGDQFLTVTNTGKTNYQVFDWGYDVIYPGQKFHEGENNIHSNKYKFCYE